MPNKYHIGRDPSCFGNVYCGDQLIAKSNGIPDELLAMVEAANRGLEQTPTQQPVEKPMDAEYQFIHECIMRPDEVIKHVSMLWTEYALCPDEKLAPKALELKWKLLASFPMRESSNQPEIPDGWQPLETAPPGYTKDKGLEQILFKGHSKAGSFAGNVYISGWMDHNRKPVYEYSYKLVITGWKPLSIIEGEAP